jgi:hypothetical protein
VTADIKVVLFYARVWEAWDRIYVPAKLHERFFRFGLHCSKEEDVPTLPLLFWIGGKEKEGRKGRPPMRLSRGIEFSVDSLNTFKPDSLSCVSEIESHLGQALDAFINNVTEYDKAA